MKSSITLFILSLLIMSSHLSANTQCDSAYVTFDGVSHVIAAGSGDDALNIQCALDEAVELGTSLIEISSGTYSITGTLFVEGYEGVVKGTTKANTTLKFNSPTDHAGILIKEGKPVFRYMTLEDNGLDPDDAIIGIQPMEDCGTRVVRAEFDRIALTGMANAVKGLVTSDGGCGKPLQGTILLNRATLTGLSNAIEISMGGGARADIYYTEIGASQYCFISQDANQSLNFVGNTCVSELGVGIFGQPPAPTVNLISGNTFESSLRSERLPVLVSDGTQPREVVTQIAIDAKSSASTVSNNTLNASNIVGTTVEPLYIKGEAAVFGNTLFGPTTKKTAGAIILSSYNASSGSAVYGNQFRENNAPSELFLESGSHLVKQSDNAIINQTADSLIAGIEADTSYTAAPSTLGGINTNNFSFQSGASITSINGFYYPGSQFQGVLTNNTGEPVQIGVVDFSIGGINAGSTNGTEFLEGGILSDGEQLGIVLTVNGSNFSGEVAVTYHVTFDDDSFRKDFVIYSP